MGKNMKGFAFVKSMNHKRNVGRNTGQVKLSIPKTHRVACHCPKEWNLFIFCPGRNSPNTRDPHSMNMRRKLRISDF